MHSTIHGDLARVLAAEELPPHLAAERPLSTRRPWRRRRPHHVLTRPELLRSRA